MTINITGVEDALNVAAETEKTGIRVAVCKPKCLKSNLLCSWEGILDTTFEEGVPRLGVSPERGMHGRSQSGVEKEVSECKVKVVRVIPRTPTRVRENTKTCPGQ